MTSRRSVTQVLAIALFGLVLPWIAVTSPASAALCGKDEDTDQQDWFCEKSGSSESGGSGSAGSKTVYTDPGPYTAKKYVPYCRSNGPGPGQDELCSGFFSCPDENDNRWWVFTQVLDSATAEPNPDAWKRAGVVCRNSQDAEDEGPPQITEWMIREAAQAQAPKSRVGSEPAGTSYVNIPNNFYTSRDPVSTSVTLIGFNIPLRYTPQSYTWKFGDGGTETGPGIRGAQVGQPGSVEWDYRRIGTYNVTVTRSFSVTATLPDGNQLTLESPVSSTSPAYPIDINEIQSVVTEVR